MYCMHIACGKYLNVKVIGNSIIFRSWFYFIMEILGYECLITNSSPWAGKGVSDPAPNGRSFTVFYPNIKVDITPTYTISVYHH